MKHRTFPHHSTALTALIVLMLVCSSLVACSSERENDRSHQATPTTNVQESEQATSTTETVYLAAEFEEAVFSTEGIVAHADDVFIGRVASAGETFSRYGHGDVWTPFTVEVEQRLLGSVEGTITVVQQGGFDPEHNVIVIVEEDPLLEVGATYMLATLNNRNDDRPDWDWQRVVMPVKGHVRIDNKAEREQLLQEYSKALNEAGLGS